MSDAICTTFKRNCLVKLAALSVRLALYRDGANLGPLTERYSPDGEVEGEGYQAGGIYLLQAGVYSKDRAAWIRWGDAVWPRSKITARWGLIYCSDNGEAIRVIDLSNDGGNVISNNGEFRVQLPSAGRGVIVLD